MRPVIALDVGTSSIRALTYSPKGKLLHSVGHSYAPTYHPSGEVRQSPSDWESGAKSVLAQAASFLHEKGLSAEAVSVTSQRASLISVDAKGEALHDAIMWHDKTTIPQCRKISEAIPQEVVYQKTGLRIDSYFSAPKLLQLRDNEKEIFNAAHFFLGVQDYVILKMTGERVSDYSQASRTLLFNIKTQSWDEEILRALDIDENRLPRLVAPGSICGYICRAFSTETGLKEGTPVVAAGGDQQVAAVGMGIFTRETAEVNTGTGSFVLTLVDEPVFHPEMKTLCSYSAIADKWVVEAGVLTTGIVFKWFAEQFTESGSPIDGVRDYEELDSLVRSSPEGSNGVILLPHFKGAAAPFWNSSARGVFFNITLATKKGDMARAIVEAIALEIGENLLLLNQNETVNIREVIVAGGMTGFPLFNRIQADVYGIPLRKYPYTEASSFGAFLSAMTALGHYSSIFEAHKSLSPPLEEARIIPKESIHDLYEAVRKQRNLLYSALDEHKVYEKLPEVEAHLYPAERRT